MHAISKSAPQRLMKRKNLLKKATCLNVQDLDPKRFSRGSVSLKYMLKSEITEIGPCLKAFTTAPMRRERTERFSTVDPVQADGSTSGRGIHSSEETADTPPSDLSQGRALSKLRVATSFTPKAKVYLNTKFKLGEKTGLKAGRNQVSADMRNARDEENNRFPERNDLQNIRLKATSPGWLLQGGKDKKRMMWMTKQNLRTYWESKKTTVGNYL